MADHLRYPPLNFHFDVEFRHKDFKRDHKFQSVDGLHAQLVKDEGQKNPHAVFDHIVLKRAFEPDSKLVGWCMDAINNKVFKAVTLTIKLLNSKHEVLSAWIVEKAIPVGWGVAELHAEESKILIETIELRYRYFQVVDSKGRIVAPKVKPKA
ncbi:MAG: phage tail protein [Aurantibacter sp.]